MVTRVNAACQLRIGGVLSPDGPTKRAIFGENSARLCNFTQQQRAALDIVGTTIANADHKRDGPGRTNLCYGYVAKPIA